MAGAPDTSPVICVLPRDVYNFNVNTRAVVEVFTDVMRLCLERGVQANEDGITDVNEAIKTFFDKGGKAKFRKDNKCKNYKDFDITSLFDMIPKVTQIKPNSTNVNLHELYEILQEIKNIRNETMHASKGTHHDNKMTDISDKMEKIVNQLGKCYNIESNELDLLKVNFHQKIKDIEDPRRAREKVLKDAIRNSMMKNNREKWAPMIKTSMESDTLPFSTKPIKRSDIFHATDFEVLSGHNIPESNDRQEHNIPASHDRQDHNIPASHDRQDHNIPASHDRQDHNTAGPLGCQDQNITGPLDHKISGPIVCQDPNITVPLDHKISGPIDCQDQNIAGPLDHKISGPIDCQDPNITVPLDHKISGPMECQYQNITVPLDHKISGPIDCQDPNITVLLDCQYQKITLSLDHKISGPLDRQDHNIPVPLYHKISGPLVLQDHNIPAPLDLQDHNIPTPLYHKISGPLDLPKHNIPGPLDHQDHKTISCTDILSTGNGPNINIIKGDPGSGKSTYLRMMCLEFCKNNSTFKSISSYDMMMFFNCRDRERIDNFWQYLCKTHYEETTQNFPDKEAVIAAMKEMKMIVAIDGLDEANDSTKALVRDVIHHFGGSKTVTFLITTRPGFSENVEEQFDKNAIQYQVLNIKPIETIDDQEKFIRRIVKQIHEINIDKIIETFTAKREALNSHFSRPLGLILFIQLFQHFPDKIEKLTYGRSLMDLSYDLHTQNMGERMPEVISNPAECSRSILERISGKSLKLIQNNCFEIDHEHYISLSVECYKINKDIPVQSVLSCVLIKRKCASSAMTAIHDFSHRSQQEYFASKVLSGKLCQEYSANNNSTTGKKTISSKLMQPLRLLTVKKKASRGDLIRVLRELTGEKVKEKDLKRLVLIC